MTAMAGKIDPNALNLKGVSTTAAPLPATDYDCFLNKVEIAEIGSGDNAGKPMLKLQWKPNAEKHPKFGKRILFDQIPVIAPDANGEGGTYWRVKALTDALGFTDADYDNDFRLEMIGAKTGTEARLRVGIREYEGEKQNTIKRYKAVDDKMPGGGAVDSGVGMPDF